jgi:hypothetical protein
MPHQNATDTNASYHNVLITRKRQGKPLLTPLLGYLPYLVHSLILVAWLQGEIRGGINIVHDARLLPFLGYWGMRLVPPLHHTDLPSMPVEVH